MSTLESMYLGIWVSVTQLHTNKQYHKVVGVRIEGNPINPRIILTCDNGEDYNVRGLTDYLLSVSNPLPEWIDNSVREA